MKGVVAKIGVSIFLTKRQMVITVVMNMNKLGRLFSTILLAISYASCYPDKIYVHILVVDYAKWKKITILPVTQHV